MADKFVDPKTKEEVFRINEEGKEVIADKFKKKWDEKNKDIDKPSKETEDKETKED